MPYEPDPAYESFRRINGLMDSLAPFIFAATIIILVCVVVIIRREKRRYIRFTTEPLSPTELATLLENIDDKTFRSRVEDRIVAALTDGPLTRSAFNETVESLELGQLAAAQMNAVEAVKQQRNR